MILPCCWNQDWVLEFDIKGLFDNIPHQLLMKAVRKHTDNPWVLLYIERWLTAPLQQRDGQLLERSMGTPQGGVISPVLSNLFLHYVFDAWMKKHLPDILWCRYADDGLVHCYSEDQAKSILERLKNCFQECGLELHPQKTKIVYCKDGQRKGQYENTSFDFLGYTFKRRLCRNRRHNSLFVSFTPAVSKANQKAMRRKIRKLRVRMRTELNIAQIAGWLNPMLSGWLAYYGRFYRSALYGVFRHFNKALVRWARRKYKPLRHRKTRASKLLEDIAKRRPRLFAHWRAGMAGAFA